MIPYSYKGFADSTFLASILIIPQSYNMHIYHVM